MAHLWIKDQREEWAVLPLEHDAFTLTTIPPQPLSESSTDSISSVLLMRTRDSDAEGWVLIAGATSCVRVNGFAVAQGIQVVTDRDEIRLPETGSIYFSSETLARVQELPGTDQIMFCPRCKQEIDRGHSAVKCPVCGVWHHQTDDLNCWTYSEACALCGHPTDLSAGFRWTPQEL